MTSSSARLLRWRFHQWRPRLVFHGSAAGLAASADWIVTGNQSYAQFGWSVGAAGDVNGDGYDDVIIGAPYYDNGQTNEGAAFIYHGSASGLSTTAGWIAESDQADAHLGHGRWRRGRERRRLR